jgi:hexosaminidase
MIRINLQSNRNIISALSKITAAVLICLSVNANAQFHIIPQPAKLIPLKGKFTLTAGAVIGVDTGSIGTGKYLQDYLAQNYKLHLKVQLFSHIPAGTAIKLVTVADTVDGAYTLKVSASAIKITGNSDGVFYGVQTIIQMLPAVAGTGAVHIAACDIADAPRFKWRGLSMDVSRHFFNVAAVKKYIDIMSHYKLNVMHWHLTDDEGWRIQIDKYPLLTQVGSRISYYEKLGKYRKLDNLVGGGSDGFYTKDDIRSVLKYAAEHHVTILPEIEMPGHSEAAIFAYPELGCKDSTGVKHRVRMLDPSEYTINFYENVLTEVIALFPNQYIHIGGDEAEIDDFLKSPTAVALMKKYGFTTPAQVQSYFIKRIEQFLLSKDKKMIGWDEILKGGLAPSATVMSWEGEDGGIAAAKMHHHVIMTPLPYMYFDAPQAKESLEPIGWNPPVPWQMVYNYEPYSRLLSPDEEDYILGLQGNIWAEKVPTMDHLEYMVYPRELAVAETAWSPREVKNIDTFQYKMYKQYGLFKLWNLNAHLPEIDSISNVVTNENNYKVTLTYPLKGAHLRYALNGKMPDSTATAVAFPVTINKPLAGKDTLLINAYTTWTLNQQHILQTAFIRHIDINPAQNTGNLMVGLSYTVYKTTQDNYNKLDSIAPAATGIVSYPQPVVLAVNGANTWVKVSGYIKIDNEGDYELSSGFEASPVLYIDNVPVISQDKDNYVEPQKALLHLKKGYYAIKGYYLADETNNYQNLLQLKTVSGRLLNPIDYLVH